MNIFFANVKNSSEKKKGKLHFHTSWLKVTKLIKSIPSGVIVFPYKLWRGVVMV